jgi:hypothetical protein
MASDQSLILKDRVHGLRADPRALAEGRAKRLRRFATAFEAGSMTGGERGRLVEEKQFGIESAPNVAMAALKQAEARDPLPRRPTPPSERLIRPMKLAAAIAHQRASGADRDKLAEWIDAIL